MIVNDITIFKGSKKLEEQVLDIWFNKDDEMFDATTFVAEFNRVNGTNRKLRNYIKSETFKRLATSISPNDHRPNLGDENNSVLRYVEDGITKYYLMNKKLKTALFQWLSPAFAIWTDTIVTEYITTGSVVNTKRLAVDTKAQAKLDKTMSQVKALRLEVKEVKKERTELKKESKEYKAKYKHQVDLNTAYRTLFIVTQQCRQSHKLLNKKIQLSDLAILLKRFGIGTLNDKKVHRNNLVEYMKTRGYISHNVVEYERMNERTECMIKYSYNEPAAPYKDRIIVNINKETGAPIMYYTTAMVITIVKDILTDYENADIVNADGTVYGLDFMRSFNAIISGKVRREEALARKLARKAKAEAEKEKDAPVKDKGFYKDLTNSAIIRHGGNKDD